MSQPVAYNPTKDFSAAEAAAEAGRSTVDTTALDTEHTNIATTINQIRKNLAILQRDDTKLNDAIVEANSLSAEVLALIASSWTPKGAWVTATNYVIGDMVTTGTPEEAYVCTTIHTAGVFATDLAAGYWTLIRSATYTAFASTSTGQGASLVGIEDAAGNFAATNVEAALAEIFTKLISVVTGNGASLIGIEDAAGNYTSVTVEAALAEIFTNLLSTVTGKGASLIGIEDAAAIYAATNVEAALLEIFVNLASTAAAKGASLIGIEDAGGYTATTEVESALQEIYATLPKMVSGSFTTASLAAGATDDRLITHGLGSDNAVVIVSAVGSGWSVSTWGGAAGVTAFFVDGNFIDLTRVNGAAVSAGDIRFITKNNSASAKAITVNYTIIRVD